MGSSSTLAGAAAATETKKPHVTWSDTMPKAFRQSHDFLRRETSSSSAAANKRESVVWNWKGRKDMTLISHKKSFFSSLSFCVPFHFNFSWTLESDNIQPSSYPPPPLLNISPFNVFTLFPATLQSPSLTFGSSRSPQYEMSTPREKWWRQVLANVSTNFSVDVSHCSREGCVHETYTWLK